MVVHKRKAGIRLNLQPEVLDRLKVVAGLLGVPPATLGALAIGQFVAQQERTIAIAAAMQDKIGEQIGSALGKELEQLSLLAKGSK